MSSFYLNKNYMISNISQEKYSFFKSSIKESLNSLFNLKNVQYEKDIKDLLIISKEKENELFYEFIFFTNYSKWILLKVDFDFNEKIEVIKEIDNFRINDKYNYSKENIKLNIHLHLYLLIQMEQNILYLSQNPDKKLNVDKKLKEINEIYHILFQNLLLILKLYKEKIYSLKQIFLFFDLIIVFIHKNSIIDDKYINLKNIILFELLFEKYLGNLLITILNNQSENKDDIVLFLDYLVKYLRSNELKSHFNYSILSNKKYAYNLINILLNNFDYNNNIDIYNKYKGDLLDCLANIYKNNTDQFNFFEILINQNKQNFINLANYKTRKDYIIKDLYSQNFYIELLHKIFSIEKIIFNPKNPLLETPPPENSFIFNGSNSKMSFKLNKFSLENSILFFSFQLDNDFRNGSSSCYFPLFIFEAKAQTEISFKIVIKRENNINKLMIYQEKKKEKNPKILNLDKIENIIPKINYYIGIRFLEKKVIIQVKKVDIKSEKDYEQEKEISPFEFKNSEMKIGYDDKTREYFKGYIGSIMIIKNLTVKKNINYNSIISNALALKNFYKFFPYISSKSADFDVDNYLYFNQYKKEKEIKSIINFIQKNIEHFDCTFYITPEIMNNYNSLSMYYIALPIIPIVAVSQGCYIINEINISITRFNSMYIEFQKSNGFDFFSLIFEYFYQFFTLIKLNSDVLDFYLKKDKLENVIIKSFNSALSLLNYFNDYKVIINNLTSFKTLFRNIFESLKQLNKISNITFQKISKSMYDLFLGFKTEQIEFSKELSIDDHNNNNNLLKIKEILFPFIDGLIDMIYDKELYINYENDNYINMLFMLTMSFVMNYIEEKKPRKTNRQNQTLIMPFKPEFMFKLLNFIQILENVIISDYTKKNKTIDFLFNLLKNFFSMIIDEKNCLEYFRQLIPFSVINYENNLIISLKLLKLINELLWKKYSLENEEVEILLNYQNKINDKVKEEKDKKIIEEINIVIACILIKTSFFNFFDNKSFDINLQLEQYINNEIVLSHVIFELKKIFEKIIKVGIEEFKPPNKSSKNVNNDNINYMDLFGGLFKFIINLFKLTINKNENAPYKDEENEIEEDTVSRSYAELFSIFSHIIELLKNEYKSKNSGTYKIYCIINFIKFYHYIIFNEIKIFEISNKKEFIDNLIQVIQLSLQFYITNCNQLFKIKIGNNEYNKTIIEIIFEIYKEYIFKSYGSIECFKSLLLKFDDIFYDKEFKSDGKYSIFYANDYLKYLLGQKKVKEKTESVLYKYKTLLVYNKNIFKSEEKFDINFCTYFLQLIIENEEKINNENYLDKKLKPRLLNFMNQLFSDILQEHKNFLNIDKKYFFKSNPYPYYTEQINYIRDKYIKKNILPEEVKIYFNSLKQNKQIPQENKEENNINETPINQPEIKEQPKLDKQNDIIKYGPLQFPEDINKIKFFNTIDKKYVWNIKKELMNNIFSLFYIDELFYNQDFCIMKKYYINKINQNPFNNSKQLNFPSTIKNFKNNLESPIFIKQFNNYMTDLFLPITHSYINNEQLSKKLSRKSSIKLKQKEFPISENDNQMIECELLKNENTFYGKLIYNDKENYFLFREEKKDYAEEDGYKYIFLLDHFWNYNKEVTKKSEKFKKTSFNKNLLILFDDVEEIIEMRISLLWKGFEIYIKNGKSYLFNFLNTNEYEAFMKDFVFKSKLKNMVRKRDFLTEKSNIYKYWVAGLISNYDYLLLLNRYSSRSFNDPTQYPIFPWLLYDYKNLESFNLNEKFFLSSLREFIRMKDEHEELLTDLKKSSTNKYQKYVELNNYLIEEKYDKIEEIFKDKNERRKIKNEDYYFILKEIVNKFKKKLRDFRYPISLQTLEKREGVKFKYLEDKQEGSKFPIHCGCHYSNSAYIYFYLMRQLPYDNLLVRLQEYNLENCNRCFFSILNLQETRIKGSDNRELIPEFFSKIEYFLNLNCDFYGIVDIIYLNLDDCEMDIFKSSGKTILSSYVKFILKHKKLLNSKTVGIHLNQWIDIIFGCNQLPPEKSRMESCNIFSKHTYEQCINLEEKLEKKKQKGNLTQNQIISKIKLSMSELINFGVAPSQLFHNPHGELNISTKNDINGELSENKKEAGINKMLEDDDEENYDIESIIIQNIRSENLFCNIKQKGVPKYFAINSTINKIFIYNEIDNIIIYDCQLFNEIHSKYFSITDLTYIVKDSNIFYIDQNSIYQIKYGFSSFYNEIFYNTNDLIDEKNLKYHSYYYDKINYLLYNKNINLAKSCEENFKIITCRHIDSTFQIHYFKYKNKKDKKRDLLEKIFSFFCEDFISSCCCVNSDSFILGLKNGKLILYKMNLFNFNKPEKQDKNKSELIEKITIKRLKYIQGHHGKINSIEIDKRLGIVITSGDDNYVFVRKLYDFEFLLPIKIKRKYQVLMTKVSSFNFLYILCFNKINKKKIIFGYTFAGIKFAKSDYGLYDNINVTEYGNIITLNNKKELTLLSGSNLEKLNIYEDKNYKDALKDIKFNNWMQYDCFLRNDEENMSKIITYFNEQKNEFLIKTLSLSDV